MFSSEIDPGGRLVFDDMSGSNSLQVLTYRTSDTMACPDVKAPQHMTSPSIRVFNTMQQDRVPLVPLTPGKIGIYVCGPTVYSFVHIGNARTFTSFDTIVRYLRYRGFEVRYVRNYTDVDDKIINAAKATGESALDLAARFIREFEADAAALHLLKPDVSPRVSETIPEIIAIIQKLISRPRGHRTGAEHVRTEARQPRLRPVESRQTR